jgi:hypothetical protein
MIEAENYDESLLTVFNEIIKEKIGLDLVFVEKPMMQDLILDMNVIPDPLPQPSPRFILITPEILPRDLCRCFRELRGWTKI